jgi:hypothetical protein
MIHFSARRWVLTLSMMLLVASPSLAYAAGLVAIVPSTCNGVGGCSSICDIAALAQNILNDSIFIAVFLAAFLFAFAGVRMLMSPTNPGQRQKATALFRNVLVGFIIILGAWLVINAVMSIMVSGNAGLPWNKIC